MLSEQVIAIIKATVPVLQSNGEDLTRHFYRRMFSGDPQVMAFFNAAHQHAGTQQRALAAAICAYAQNIENLDALGEAVELIAHKHVSLNIKAEHYPIVGKHLLGSIREVLGEAATDEVIDAWAQAYQLLADILIAREAEIYAEQEQTHGWSGFRRFVVKRKVKESEIITSFYLEPVEGKLISAFQAGQYLTVRVPGPNGGTTMRNYSLSCKPGESYYRISVKREPAATPDAPAGYVSHYLHNNVEAGDELEIAPPCGNFTLSADEDDQPLVLISGGVGITPMMAMLHTSLEQQPQRPVYFIHGALNGRTHAFKDELRQVAASHGNVRLHVRYSEPDAGDTEQDSNGFIDVELLQSLLGKPIGSFYLCGPAPFMRTMFATLRQWGVHPEQVHHEFFGPAEALAQPVASAG